MDSLVYGNGKCYQDYKQAIFRVLKPRFICSPELDHTNDEYFDGLKIVSTEEAFNREDGKVIICEYDRSASENIELRFKGTNNVLVHGRDYGVLSGAELKAKNVRGGRYGEMPLVIV